VLMNIMHNCLYLISPITQMLIIIVLKFFLDFSCNIDVFSKIVTCVLEEEWEMKTSCVLTSSYTTNFDDFK
jgi:hypothetical protein